VAEGAEKLVVVLMAAAIVGGTRSARCANPAVIKQRRSPCICDASRNGRRFRPFFPGHPKEAVGKPEKSGVAMEDMDESNGYS
jgi:hypothetical protein